MRRIGYILFASIFASVATSACKERPKQQNLEIFLTTDNERTDVVQPKIKALLKNLN